MMELDLMATTRKVRSLSRLRVGQSHMVFTRLIGWVASPLPLAGEADALEERGGWGLSPHRESQCRSTPTPALPRKRGRGRGRTPVSYFTSEQPPSAIGRNA